MSDASPPKKRSKLLWIVGGVVVVIVLVAVANQGKKKEEDKKVQEQKPIEVSAAQLLSEYKDNETRANDQYKGKVVQVTGPIHRITEGHVELKGSDAIVVNRVNCQFEDADRKTLASLSSGSQITIKGICEGKQAININLKRCKIGE